MSGLRTLVAFSVTVAVVISAAVIVPVRALDNGAADTPPLGWCSWQRYRCEIACNDSTSRDCFNERLIRDTADAMVELGYKVRRLLWCAWLRARVAHACTWGGNALDNVFVTFFGLSEVVTSLALSLCDCDGLRTHHQAAGYEYVTLDDCWQAPMRVDGHVVADPYRFPSGMKALADYVHGKGLKFGIYTVGRSVVGSCADSCSWLLHPRRPTVLLDESTFTTDQRCCSFACCCA